MTAPAEEAGDGAKTAWAGSTRAGVQKRARLGGPAGVPASLVPVQLPPLNADRLAQLDEVITL